MTKYDRLSKEELLKIIEKQEKELDLKKYGLVWDREKEPEQVVLDCENNLPILKRINEKQIKTGNNDDNILIEGDNYHSLTCLSYTHKGKIDLIYIDPPYNTGKEDELELSKNLLKEEGIIFISMGEQELANLVLLCGKVFGHENSLTIMARRMKAGSNQGKFFAPSCDFVVCYAKNKIRIDTSNFYDEIDEDSYTKEDENGKYEEKGLFQSSLETRMNLRYYIQCPDGSLVIPPGKTLLHKKKKGYQFQVRLMVLINNEDDQDGKKSKYNIYVKSYLETRREKGVKPRNFLVDKNFLNSRATNYLKNLGLDFPYSKPKELIIHLIEITHTPKDAIILDFFAGSGTTGEAVLELNQEEKSQRKFILCTNNEGQIAEEVCYPRLEKIIKGLGGNLQYFQTDLISVEKLTNISDGKRHELTEKAGKERDLVLIVDEAHIETDTQLANEVINLFDPRIIIRVTATPKIEPGISEVRQKRAGFVEVPEKEVKKSGLIKEKIVIQTKEEIEKLSEKKQFSEDEIMLELAYNKRLELKKIYESLGLDINPLVLIQLPSDFKEKEEVETNRKNSVLSYLKAKSVKGKEIAIWLSNEKTNLDMIEKNNNCPRAEILVMFREVDSPIFRTQIIGRIKRMPEGYHYEREELNKAYIFTNYDKNHIRDISQLEDKNKIPVHFTKLKKDVERICLETTYHYRTDFDILILPL
ncbi:3359_t:CDS:2 [Entrophospora sp. SA101]|nr:3359_t:CDS:2 [Entrophospora sp. SA101]